MSRSAWTNANFYVDPQNSSGHASDANNGTTSSTPILTTSELSNRLYQHDVQVSSTINYLSDDSSATLLDLSTISIGLTGTGDLTFQGTPTVLHSTGTINTGTTAINPQAAGGGQRQLLHTSDIASFASYVWSGNGGSGAHPVLVVDATTGAYAWVVSGTGTASMSKPVDSTGFTAESLTIGNSYKLQRGSTLQVAFSGICPGASAGALNFNDFAFSTSHLGAHNATYNRCSFESAFGADGTLMNCYVGSGYANVEGGSIVMLSGVFIPTINDLCIASLALGGDVYVTTTSLLCSPGVYSSIFMNQGSGAGVQFQDVQSSAGALIISGTYCFDSTNPSPPGKIWGNGNSGPGVLVNPGCSLAVAVATSTNRPSITGGGGELVFQDVNGTTTTSVKNKSGTSYTFSWANFLDTTKLNYAAFCGDTGASVIGV